MTQLATDFSLQATLPSYEKSSVDGSSLVSRSRNISTQPKSKFEAGRRVFKETIRTVNTVAKTAFSSEQRPQIQALRQALSVLKQAVALVKVIKAAFFAPVGEKGNWRVDLYRRINLLQALIVGIIVCAPFFQVNYQRAREMVIFCHLTRAVIKLGLQSERESCSLKEENIGLLKNSKALLSLSVEIFALYGCMYETEALPKNGFLVLGLIAVNIGVLKSFYKQIEPIDEFSTFS